MGVLPASSGLYALPKCYRNLMSDALSPIIHFYPTDFKLDLNGKRFAWQGVIILPFINEKELLKALKPLESKLTIEEKRMNSIGNTFVFVNTSHPLAKSMIHVNKKCMQWVERAIESGTNDNKLIKSLEKKVEYLFLCCTSFDVL